jgi:hypothetical protein
LAGSRPSGSITDGLSTTGTLVEHDANRLTPPPIPTVFRKSRLLLLLFGIPESFDENFHETQVLQTPEIMMVFFPFINSEGKTPFVDDN